ncbi:MAG: cytochrome c, partial [Planctomycetia bacterium]|nr:cytochrome c [Planctomycetia bacterium]
QVDFFVGRVEQSLEDPADFDLAKQSRNFEDGNTLAALALMLALSNEEHPLKASMPRLLKASQALSAADDNVARAQAALAEIKAARAGSADPRSTVKWERVASLGALMKQVPLIHAGLKRGVEGNRLARQAVQSAGQSAALAAIAQASMLDTEHVKKPEDIEKWRQFCAQMRDASGEVNSAVHAQDPKRVAAGMKRLAQSCDACHAVFRSE